MDKWTTGLCEANEINIHYLRTGGNKPSIILLHGLIGNGSCWLPLAKALEEDYDVIMPDARGHGRSSIPEQGYSYDSLAADVLGLIEALSISNPIVLGHSMGGMTAAVVANQNSKQLKGLILVDPTFLTPKRQREVYESDVAAQHCQILNQPREDFLAEMRMKRPHRSSELVELLVQARYQTSPKAFGILMPPNPDYRQLIKALDIPSLLVLGGVGAAISVEAAAELARLNQYLKVTQIAEAGHGIPYDQPERLAVVVKDFFCM
ncbi:MAG: alpha/beta hydrolase [Simkaniaceae bacterium]|nr:alpha/beta hydrolase [Simkaniaceae bacterium]